MSASAIELSRPIAYTKLSPRTDAIYTVSPKNCTNCFGENFVKFSSMLIIFSR